VDHADEGQGQRLGVRVRRDPAELLPAATRSSPAKKRRTWSRPRGSSVSPLSMAAAAA
jgi:hypothetical protein